MVAWVDNLSGYNAEDPKERLAREAKRVWPHILLPGSETLVMGMINLNLIHRTIPIH